MKKYCLTIFAPLLVLAFLTGCGGDAKVTGKVTFPDGTPLTVGQVMFEKEGFIGSGNIRADGTYSAGKLKDGDGLPPGNYQVYISGAMIYPESEAVQRPGELAAVAPMLPPTDLIDYKYMSASTSNLTVDVKGKTTFDIKVEAPKK